MNTLPIVSVCCIASHHAPLLAQGIESVLLQETDFAVELIVGEDGITDEARALAQDYERRYPGRVRLLAPAPGRGAVRTLLAMLATCRGEFIALLEADDYWTDPSKLHRQVAALRARPVAALCCHDAEQPASGEPRQNRLFSELYPAMLPPPGSREVQFSQADSVRAGRFLPGSSLLFRASSLPRPLPDWLAQVCRADYTLQLVSTSQGPALYLPRVMACHRGGGQADEQPLALPDALSWNGQYIREQQQYQQHLPAALRPYFSRSLENLLFERSKLLGSQGKAWNSLYYYGKAMRVDKSRFLQHLKHIVSNLVR